MLMTVVRREVKVFSLQFSSCSSFFFYHHLPFTDRKHISLDFPHSETDFIPFFTSFYRQCHHQLTDRKDLRKTFMDHNYHFAAFFECGRLRSVYHC